MAVVSGHAFRRAERSKKNPGFSPCVTPAGAEAQILSGQMARLKPCPDTNILEVRWPQIQARGGGSMKALLVIGFVIVVLGILSFFVPVPHTERHSVDAGDIRLGVNTHHDELLPPYVGVMLIAVGGALMVVGGRKRA